MKNWGGTYTYLAGEVTTPGSIDELAATIRGAAAVRMVGTRHTFTGISDAPTMVGLAGLGERFELDREAGTVTIDGAMSYGRLTELLAPHDLALHNLASLAHLSVAGAVSTATHGSGDGNGCLSTAVVGLELVTAAGDVLTRGVTPISTAWSSGSAPPARSRRSPWRSSPPTRSSSTSTSASRSTPSRPRSTPCSRPATA
ncbi:MAG: FAD-binding protein [Actinomycetota bacterium]